MSLTGSRFCVCVVLVMSLLENVTTDVYIGLNDRQTNAHFVWQTNEEVVLTNWAPNQPSERWRLLGGSSVSTTCPSVGRVVTVEYVYSSECRVVSVE